MKKQIEFSGATAWDFVENVEIAISNMETDCSRIWRVYYIERTEGSEYWREALANCPDRQEQDRQYYLADARSRIKSNLFYYNRLPLWNGKENITKEDIEHLAYRIQLQKAARRIAARYDIELN